ncbi:MAG TPA: hypothetical protein PLQ69_10805 [Paludibacter sp.]|nr:hypothetical protein [Paludibacter sp.]
MKQFFKITLATIVGIIIATILGIFVLFGILGAIAASGDTTVKLKPNTVYQLDLSGQLVDRSEDDPFTDALSELSGQSALATVGLDDILANIEKAKNDSNIVGIYLKVVFLPVVFRPSKKYGMLCLTLKLMGNL